MTEPTITPRPYIDRKTGQSRKVYLYKGKSCPSVVLNSPVARRYAGYSLIHADLLDAKEWLNGAHSLVPKKKKPKAQLAGQSIPRYFLTTDVPTFQLVKALWFASIILYVKCFGSADGRKVKLERANLPAGHLGVHDKIITYRNTIVAHAGVTTHESSETKLVLSPNPTMDRLWLRTDVNRDDFVVYPEVSGR